MIIKQIKIICIDQPLRFRTKNLIIPAGILVIKFVCAHFILVNGLPRIDTAKATCSWCRPAEITVLTTCAYKL
jgi:hypothetical protein